MGADRIIRVTPFDSPDTRRTAGATLLVWGVWLAVMGYAGLRCLRGTASATPARWIGPWLLIASGGAVALGSLYFTGYDHPSWNPPNPGLVPSAKVILKMYALGFGAAAFFAWDRLSLRRSCFSVRASGRRSSAS